MSKGGIGELPFDHTFPAVDEGLGAELSVVRGRSAEGFKWQRRGAEVHVDDQSHGSDGLQRDLTFFRTPCGIGKRGPDVLND